MNELTAFRHLKAKFNFACIKSVIFPMSDFFEWINQVSIQTRFKCRYHLVHPTQSKIRNPMSANNSNTNRIYLTNNISVCGQPSCSVCNRKCSKMIHELNVYKYVLCLQHNESIISEATLFIHAYHTSIVTYQPKPQWVCMLVTIPIF